MRRERSGSGGDYNQSVRMAERRKTVFISCKQELECKIGSAQEFDGACILSRFLKNDKFCFCDRHALRLEQQVGEIFVAAAPSKKGFDVAVDGFHHSEAYLAPALVEYSVQWIRHHLGQP